MSVDTSRIRISHEYRDLLSPGVVIALSPAEAAALRMVEEDAVDATAAWEANGDPSEFDEAGESHGG